MKDEDFRLEIQGEKDWDSLTSQVRPAHIRKAASHASKIESFSVYPAENLFVTCCNKRILRIFKFSDINTPIALFELPASKGTVFYLLPFNEDIMVCIDDLAVMVTFSMNTNQALDCRRVHIEPNFSLAQKISSDCFMIANDSGDFYFYNFLMRKVQCKTKSRMKAHDGFITAYHSHRHRMVTAGLDGCVKLWDLVRLKFVCCLHKGNQYIESVAINDSIIVTCGNCETRMFSTGPCFSLLRVFTGHMFDAPIRLFGNTDFVFTRSWLDTSIVTLAKVSKEHPVARIRLPFEIHSFYMLQDGRLIVHCDDGIYVVCLSNVRNLVDEGCDGSQVQTHLSSCHGNRVRRRWILAVAFSIFLLKVLHR